MSWLFSQALVEVFSEDTSLDGEPSALSSGNPTPQAYCAPDKMTGFSRLSRYGMTYKPLTATLGEELLTLYREVFHAKTSALPEKAQESPENGQECGPTWRGSLAKFDPDSSLWKTVQLSLLGDSELSSVTWPASGMTAAGQCWEQRTLEQTIRGTEFGLLLPTPDTVNRDNKKVLFDRNAESQSGRSLATYARTFSNQFLEQTNNGGSLNPTWVEWLMGWPLGWTDLKPLETDKSPCVQLPPGGC